MASSRGAMRRPRDGGATSGDEQRGLSDKTDEHGLSRKVAVPYRSFIARDPIFHL